MRIKNWEKFQHYKNRKPSWIKLYRDLLDDVEWFRLSDGASKLLVMCWLIASEDEGRLPSLEELSFRVRMEPKKVSALLSTLSHWLEQDDSNVLADCKQSACLEKEKEKEKEKEPPNPQRGGYTPGFESSWKAFPLKGRKAKSACFDVWRKKGLEKMEDEILSAINLQVEMSHFSGSDGREFVPNFRTWLNQGRWEDEIDGGGQDDEFYRKLKEKQNGPKTTV